MNKNRNGESDHDDHNLGPCCVCETTKKVRNIMMLHFKATVPGTGWGCVVCGLPDDGASAVVCDSCFEEPLKYACKGYIASKERIPIEELTEKFDHDYRYHPDAITWFKDSPVAGHPKCLCSFCGQRIDELNEHDPGPIRITKRLENIEARFHQKCFEKVAGLFS